MQLLYISFGLAIVIAVAMQIISILRVKKMTKDKLIEKCKKLIDSGRVSAVQSTLMRHPKLLLIHFNELQTTLTEYARSVEENKSKKEVK